MAKRFILRRRFLFLLDIGLVCLSFLMAGAIRFEAVDILAPLAEQQSLLWLSLVVRLPLYAFFGLYNRLWRYASVIDAARLVFASATAIVVIHLINFLLLPLLQVPHADSHSILLLDGMLNVLFLGASRFGRRLHEDWLQGRKDIRIREKFGSPKRMLVVGAGNAGEFIVRQMKNHPSLGIEAVGFVDENQAMHHMRIHDVPIVGGVSQLPKLVREHAVDEVIVTPSEANNGNRETVESLCRSVSVPVSTMPGLYQILAKAVDRRELLATQRDTPRRASLKFQNLLVTGACGFIGANFVHYMLKKYPNYRIVVYDKVTYAGNPNNLLGLAEEYGERYAFVKGDICDAGTVRATMKKYQIDGIVNFAAETHVDRSLMAPENFARTNIHGTHVLLESARELNVQRYHQISTDEVYGQILYGSFKEVDPIDCRSPYSASKASGDVMALAYANSFGLPVTISRGSNSIGPYQHVEKAVPLFVTNALESTPLPVYGDGLYERDYQFVLDHCAGVDTILHRGREGEVYNLGSGRETAALELAKKILQLLDKPLSLIRFVEDRAGQDRRYSLDCTKVIALGWRPAHSTEQALEKTVRWYVDNEWWWHKVKRGEFQEYYRLQYGKRLRNATIAAWATSVSDE